MHAKIGADGVIVVGYRHGFMNRALALHMTQLSRVISQAGVLDFVPDRTGPPGVMAWLEPGEMDDVMRGRIGEAEYGLPPFFEIQCQREAIHPAALDELNCQVFPEICRLLVPTHPVDADVTG